ncbi:hypothetical protein [Heyndrickxia oleronia]|uniref:hypothetical protein n=1 Tax=Heyndrickxia oleronia TaxID=38875 RepID=UPI0024324ADC|nr:hypothetical protein [Heyndrickxia oleronia]MCI1590396.1 hypothetical protein [Heyndrickxia oleronia]MCI1611342.1 hypothetical protein [Heyndrickxia oleronia]MCI1742785.1 hypothetical protein [Heyndrickxia oleronia]MCI1763130.1 hypothetical protein [Heyndrickxia oleronia]
MRITLTKREFQKAVRDYVEKYYDEDFKISDIRFSNFERYVAVGEVDLILKKKSIPNRPNKKIIDEQVEVKSEENVEK